MHTLEPARLKSGINLEDLPTGDGPRGEDGGADAHVIRGEALILWDPENAGPNQSP